MTKKPEQLSLFPLEPEKPLVYVSGPMTTVAEGGSVAHNLRTGLLYAARFIEEGVVVPFVPHTSYLWELVAGLSSDQMLQYDLEVLAHADAMFRLPGVSTGAKIEESRADELGIPVFHRVVDLYGWSRARAAA